VSIVWTAEARRSLRAIQRFIAQDSPFYADRVVSRIIEYPEAPLREVHESSYRIIYLVREETLHVVTVVHFKQALNPGRVRGV
jgi:toxin ParE1/3/4